MKMVRKWQTELELKGLRVNVGKTKVMNCKFGSGAVEESGKYPCGVCNKGVGNNSILCTKCKRWIHKRCSKVKGKITSNVGFQCPKCRDLVQKHDAVHEERSLVMDAGVKFENVDRFCYLGDMIGAGGGAELASRMRVRCAWNKFRELSPILTARGASLKLKGKIYKACVRSVMVYGSETWPMKVEDMQRLERAERMMVRWMCGVSLKDKVSSEELLSRLGVESVYDIVRRGRLRWFGHVERKPNEDWVKRCQSLEVAGKAGRGRGRKTWLECVKHDMKDLGLCVEDARDRGLWKGKIFGETSKPRKRGKQT